MSWIQQNKFITSLAAATIVLCGALLYLGSKGSSRYQDLLDDFRQAESRVSTFERLELYPNQANLDGKTKALADFEESIASLKSRFEQFRLPAAERISPQDFSVRLGETNEEVTSRLRDANVNLPDGFYSGFEGYTAGLAQSGATPVLGRQLTLVDSIFSDLAAARPAELINFRRIRQPEETGDEYQPDEGDITRPHSFELTFRGSEASARRFLTNITNTDDHFTAIRTVRIRNERGEAPTSSDTRFETQDAVAPAQDGPFDGGFFGAFDDFLDEDEDGGGEPAFDDEPTPAPPPVQSGGNRMLAQVVGGEHVEVFIRFDIKEFLTEPADDADDDS